MIHKTYNYLFALSLLAMLGLGTSCERELDVLVPAEFPVDGNVFIDGFSGGLEYAAFGGSDVRGFQVVDEGTYTGSAAMRFSVPDFQDPAGSFVGGVFFVPGGRDLSSFNVLTFWARASRSATLNEVGFGNDLGENRFVAVANNIPINTNWKKYYIPIPDPSKLTQESGMFYYAEGPENGQGYTFWIDEVKFENIGTIALIEAGIFGGEDRVQSAETGATINPEGYAVFDLTNGLVQRVAAAPAYFDLTSDNTDVATIDENGFVNVLSEGEAVITGKLMDLDATGSLTITSTGMASIPTTAPPTPMVPAADVISLYSNAYTNQPLDFINGFWEGSTTLSEEIQVAGDDVIRYTQLNFVGIQFTAPLIDVRNMTHLHLDIWTPDETAPPADFRVKLYDFGPNGAFEGVGAVDDTEHEVVLTSPTLQSGQWVSLDLPLSNFVGLTGRANLAQLILSGAINNVFVDNIYFYNDGGGTGGGDEPTVAAPTPTEAPGDVISLFSDAYTDVPVDTWRTEWTEGDFADVTVAGNATKLYTNLTFAGIETVMNQLDITDMTTFHMDVWTPNATTFRVKLVDFGPNGTFEGPGMGDDTEHEIVTENPTQGQWISLDIPMSEFTGLTSRANFAQLVLSGVPEGVVTLYVDNVYFSRGGSGGGDEPTAAAPTPTEAPGGVISLFSDAYTDVPVDTWLTEWSEADLADVAVAGNAVKKYTNVNFLGVETVMNQIDLTSMSTLHLDLWTPNATTFRVKLVDFGPNGTFEGPGMGDDTEHELVFENPAQGEWISYELPLADFTGLTSRANFSQLVLSAVPENGATLFIDNVYFSE